MDTHLSPKAGSALGATLLIAGCCIGAGMLGLPVMSGIAGFKPSVAMCVLGWLFMTTTALLILEINSWFSDEISIISMAGRTLGNGGKIAGWACFLFLFYALGVAYVAGSGELISAFVQEIASTAIPSWAGSLAVCLLFGIFVYMGTAAVDWFNRFLMAGLILSYVVIVALGAPHVNREYLHYQNWSFAPLILPVMIISFGFHNLVPSLSIYLKGDVNRLRTAIICGSAIPLFVYLIWEWMILGLVPLAGSNGFLEAADKGGMATEVLKNAVGIPWIPEIVGYFAFFAILTSFLGNSLSFVDFLADGLHVKKTHMGKFWLCLLVIVPPFALALAYPRIFLTALNYAGAFGAMILFGVMPALMVWAGRYRKKIEGRRLVPGGRAVLALVILFALWVMVVELIEVI